MTNKDEKPLVRIELELWASSFHYLKHGVSWHGWFGLWLFNRPLYLELKRKIKEKECFARGVYDVLNEKVILCLDDISASVEELVRSTPAGTNVNMRLSFIMQFYYTLLHELLHHANVSKKHGCDHDIDFEKYEKLPMWLKILFDDFLTLMKSGDAFGDNNGGKR